MHVLDTHDPCPIGRGFLLSHALLIPMSFALAGLVAQRSGLDWRLSAMFFDAGLGTFPARGWPALEILGHQLAKSVVIAGWLGLLGLAVASMFVQRLRGHASVLWTVVGAMAAGPAIVVALKGLNAYHCPWDLKKFGGIADVSSGWFVPHIAAGNCFPSGHAAGGFCLVALYFAGIAAGKRTLASAGLVAAIVAGVGFSLVRMIQGAHFLSHNLWSAAIDWSAAALVFAPLLVSAAQWGTPSRVPAPRTRPSSSASWQKATRADLGRLAGAMRNSLAGLRVTWTREAALRQELAVALVLLPVALLATLDGIERLLLVGSLLLVLIVELLNSAIEAVVDLVSPEDHPLAKIAKDAASAAVMLALALAAAVWIVTFWPGR